MKNIDALIGSCEPVCFKRLHPQALMQSISDIPKCLVLHPLLLFQNEKEKFDIFFGPVCVRGCTSGAGTANFGYTELVCCYFSLKFGVGWGRSQQLPLLARCLASAFCFPASAHAFTFFSGGSQ